MKKAVIDLGTNTFHLLIASFSENNFDIIYKEMIGVKLGEGTINNNIINDDAFKRGINAISYFKNKISEYNITDIKLIGTSALRNTSNGGLFVSEVKEKFNLDIEIINGIKEAEYIYNGVKNCVGLNNELSLIMDIGGGSVEFIVCNNKKALHFCSIEIGVQRIIQLFNISNPITNDEFNEITSYFDEKLSDLISDINKLGQINTLIGSSGTFESFDYIMQNNYKDDITSNYYNHEIFVKMLNSIIHSTSKYRETTLMINNVRLDLIVSATIICNFIIKKLNIKNITYSKFALKEGVLLSN